MVPRTHADVVLFLDAGRHSFKKSLLSFVSCRKPFEFMERIKTARRFLCVKKVHGYKDSARFADRERVIYKKQDT